MRDKDLKRLGYDLIKERLRSYAHSPATEELIEDLKPIRDRERILESISLVIKLTRIADSITLPDFPDIRHLLKRSRVEGSHLTAQEMLELLSVLEILKELRKVLGGAREGDEDLRRLLKRIHSFSALENMILSVIDRRGFVKDSASEKLYKIRREIRSLEKEIDLRIESLFSRPDADTIFTDKIVTIRNNRYVVPVKTSHSKSIFGIVHGTSSSGFTTYIEPQFIVHLNNRISELKDREDEEVRRILVNLTSHICEFADRIEESFLALTELDLFLCRVMLGKELGGTFPEIGERIELRGAVHPLLILEGQEAVPVDILLTEKKGLILTGPNTGGKTVALKTLGLIALMTQSAIPVPLSPQSVIPVFDQVFVDVGDEQSIQQSLSTFSSHMTNISDFLPFTGEKTLVLLDELGAGTDPMEGSALAIGILEYLKERNSWVFANTHHMPVKVYAINSDYYTPASVLFDRESLKPLYTIAYNTVGESMAFEVARTCGLPPEIIEIAEGKLGEMGREYIRAVDKLSEFTKSYEEKLREIEELRKKLEEEIARYQSLREELEEHRKRGWKEAYREARRYLKSLYEEGERILKDLRDRSDLEDFVREKREELGEFRKRKGEIPSVGDTVIFEGGKGKVVRVEGNKVWIVSGGVRLEVDLELIERVEKGGLKEKRESRELPHPKGSLTGSEINLIGKDRETALIELERFIESAWASGLRVVRIIHGLGEGVLQKAVHEYLSGSEKVKFFRSAYPREGGSGVTVAYLNQEG
jgi:DNA mismatch repair protein MutS2